MSWIPIAKPPTKRGNNGRIVVHDGRIVWLWYGEYAECATYDPNADRWTPLPSFDQTRRTGALVASAGTTLVVFSGAPHRRYSDPDPPTPGGYRLDGETWRPLATKHQPSARLGAHHVWTGTELVVWGGDKRGPVATGAAYDPVKDSWRKLATNGAPPSRTSGPVWSGRELWLFDKTSGFAYAPPDDRWRAIAGPKGRHYGDAFARLGDGALYVQRDEPDRTDTAIMSAWTYDAAADRWNARTKPPEVRGAAPTLIECGDRVVLALNGKLFEYLVAEDAWGPQPALLDKHLYEAEYAWLAGALYCFPQYGYEEECWRLELPPTPASVAAVPVPLTNAPEVDIPRGPAVTAVVLADNGAVLAGHLDGSVRFDGELVRAPDQQRIWGLAYHRAHWTCLLGDVLEIRAGAGQPARVSVPFAAHSLAHRGDTLAVGGIDGLAVYTWERATWQLAKSITASDVLEVALSGDGRTLAAVTIGAKKDLIELRGASDLELIGTIKSPFERGTSSAIPMSDSTAIVAGGGSYDMERRSIGKTRATDKLHTSCAWSAPIVASANGRWLASRDAGAGVELHDLEASGRRELLFSPLRGPGSSSDGDEPLDPPPHPANLFQPKRWGGSVSAIAIDDRGATLAVGTVIGATYVIDREGMGLVVRAHDGTRHELQPARAERSEVMKPLAIGGDAMRGVVTVIDGNGRMGELDVGSGVWTWGGTVAPAEPFESELAWNAPTVRRRGRFVTDAQGNVFDWATGARIPPEERRSDPDDLGLCTIVDRDLIERDAITLDERSRSALPGPVPTPMTSGQRTEIEWLGGKRWFVELATTSNAYVGVSHIVDTSSGVVTPVPFKEARPSLDGRHFCEAGKEDYARRWNIYADDVTTPRAFTSPVPLRSLAVLPGAGALLGWTSSELLFFASDGTRRQTYRGISIAGVCPSRDGKYVVTWTYDGLFRRWPVPD